MADEESTADGVDPLVAAATKKSGLLWLSVGAEPARALWHVWHDDAAYVLTGAGEQQLPGIERATRATVTVRGDKGGRAVTWPADVSTVDVDSAEWAELVPELMAKRLNLPDGEQAPQRWRTSGTVTRLDPAGPPTETVETADTLPTGSLAEPPRPTTATTPTRLPYVLGRGRKARRARRGSSGGG